MRLDAYLLLGLSQRCLERIVVLILDRASGKSHLTGMGINGMSPASEKQVPNAAIQEKRDQHGGWCAVRIGVHPCWVLVQS
jgi:hypothetical protein